MWVEATLPGISSAGGNYKANVGHKLLKSVEVEIGGQRIDKHYGDWLEIWNELSQTAGHSEGYEKMVNGAKLAQGEAPVYGTSDTPLTDARTVYVPLQFWFCRNPGLALPLIALQYHEVKINIEFAEKSALLAGEGTDAAGDVSANLYVDYVYLDTDERRRFAQVSHEYLIEQLQFTGDEAPSTSIKMNFNHPVKEIVWVEVSEADGSYTSTYTEAQITLNSHERMSMRNPMYFQLVQPYQHHERVPSVPINVYSFALKPEEHQPSGTCNMSRIDTATLKLTGAKTDATMKGTKVFATNYNVLRIMSGMGGLAYSN
jgi:hypothetical protein